MTVRCQRSIQRLRSLCRVSRVISRSRLGGLGRFSMITEESSPRFLEHHWGCRVVDDAVTCSLKRPPAWREKVRSAAAGICISLHRVNDAESMLFYHGLFYVRRINVYVFHIGIYAVCLLSVLLINNTHIQRESLVTDVSDWHIIWVLVTQFKCFSKVGLLYLKKKTLLYGQCPVSIKNSPFIINRNAYIFITYHRGDDTC